jgi:hypothetical protein
LISDKIGSPIFTRDQIKILTKDKTVNNKITMVEEDKQKSLKDKVYGSPNLGHMHLDNRDNVKESNYKGGAPDDAKDKLFPKENK